MRWIPLLALTACAHRIPDAGLAPAAPAGAANPALQVCWVEFSTGTLPHKLAVAKGALDEDVVSTASGLLLVQPGAAWLIDGGMGLDVPGEVAELHGVQKVLMKQASAGWTRKAEPAAALKALGVDPSALTGTIPTHAHFDHLGGLLLLDAPLYLPQVELDLAAAALTDAGSPVLPAEARALAGRGKALTFDGGPFLYWDHSRDLFGDGSAVLVPLPGHTPGSLGVHVTLADGRRLMLVGDTVWTREGYEQRLPKSGLASSFDEDGDANDQQIARLWALHQAQPDLAILPAHDRRTWEAFFGKPGCVGANPG